ncbi:MAG: hypothetical protein R2818_11340 [Flavobacteriales bacterium]
MLDGLERYGAGWHWDLPNKKTEVQAEVLYFIRRDSSDLTYLLYPDQWDLNRLNGALDLSMLHHYDHDHGEGLLKLELRTSAVGSASAYSQLRFTAVNSTDLGPLQLRTRGSGNMEPVPRRAKALVPRRCITRGH